MEASDQARSGSLREDPERSLDAAVIRIGQGTGVDPDTLRGRAKQAAIDAGKRPGPTTSEAKQIKDLEAECGSSSAPTKSG